jgi:hypothetical protein
LLFPWVVVVVVVAVVSVTVTIAELKIVKFAAFYKHCG